MILSTHTRYTIHIIFELHLAKSPVSIAMLPEQTNFSQKAIETESSETTLFRQFRKQLLSFLYNVYCVLEKRNTSTS